MSFTRSTGLLSPDEVANRYTHCASCAAEAIANLLDGKKQNMPERPRTSLLGIIETASTAMADEGFPPIEETRQRSVEGVLTPLCAFSFIVQTYEEVTRKKLETPEEQYNMLIEIHHWTRQLPQIEIINCHTGPILKRLGSFYTAWMHKGGEVAESLRFSDDDDD